MGDYSNLELGRMMAEDRKIPASTGCHCGIQPRSHSHTGDGQISWPHGFPPADAPIGGAGPSCGGEARPGDAAGATGASGPGLSDGLPVTITDLLELARGDAQLIADDLDGLEVFEHALTVAVGRAEQLGCELRAALRLMRASK